MTEFLHQDRLRLIARVIEQVRLQEGRPIPTMAWTLDAETGRPVCRWVLESEPRAQRVG